MKLLDLIREAAALESSQPLADDDGVGSFETWDSLAHVRLLASLERIYGIKIEEQDFELAMTVAGLRELLRRKGVPDP